MDSACDTTVLEFKGITDFYLKNKDNLKFVHLNINSVRYKFVPLENVLRKSMINIMSLQETKLDESFPQAQFSVPGYRLHRKDHQSNSGGLLMLVSEDLPQRRRQDLEATQAVSGRVELLVIEIMFRKEKWLLFSVYKQPQVRNSCIRNICDFLVDKGCQETKNLFIFGDFNIDMSCKSNCLNDLFDVLGVKNMVYSPTCFKNRNGTTVDLLVTSVPKRIQNVTVIDCELSDCHRMVLWATKLKAPVKTNRTIFYRTLKHFDEKKYQKDLSIAPFHVSEIFDSADDSYWFCNKLLTNVINEHAPLKVTSSQVPYMNDALRKAINVRNMFKRQYYHYKSNNYWRKYKQQRNYVNSLRRKSLQNYIYLKCKQPNGVNSKTFWSTIKPVISDKCRTSSNNITLLEDGKIINDHEHVGSILNEYYVNITKDIGQPDKINNGTSLDEMIALHINKSCISRIISNVAENNHFTFQYVCTEDIFSKLMNIDCKKSSGYDGIQPRFIKIGARQLCGPVTQLFNKSIQSSIFPDSLKYAEVTPVFKKDDMLNKKNYRPVSILPCMSKIFEGVLVEQLITYFNDIFSSFLSGFRKQHSCHNVLLRYVENCKKTLGQKYVLWYIIN